MRLINLTPHAVNIYTHVTDDAQAVELLGPPIALLENNQPNPKITTPADLEYLEFLLARAERAASARPSSSRAPF